MVVISHSDASLDHNEDVDVAAALFPTAQAALEAALAAHSHGVTDDYANVAEIDRIRDRNIIGGHERLTDRKRAKIERKAERVHKKLLRQQRRAERQHDSNRHRRQVNDSRHTYALPSTEARGNRSRGRGGEARTGARMSAEEAAELDGEIASCLATLASNYAEGDDNFIDQFFAPLAHSHPTSTAATYTCADNRGRGVDQDEEVELGIYYVPSNVPRPSNYSSLAASLGRSDATSSERQRANTVNDDGSVTLSTVTITPLDNDVNIGSCANRRSIENDEEGLYTVTSFSFVTPADEDSDTTAQNRSQNRSAAFGSSRAPTRATSD